MILIMHYNKIVTDQVILINRYMGQKIVNIDNFQYFNMQL